MTLLAGSALDVSELYSRPSFAALEARPLSGAALEFGHTFDLAPFDSGATFDELGVEVDARAFEQAPRPLESELEIEHKTGGHMSLLDALFSQTVARALATTDAPVDVAAGPPGETGHVLTLYPDPLHAQWRPPAASGGGATISVEVVTTEALAAGDLVNVFDQTGSKRSRRANAANARRAHGFVKDAFAPGDVAVVFLIGVNENVSGKTAGRTLFLSGTTPGACTHTAPTGAGVYAQSVGYAIEGDSMMFVYSPPATHT